MKTLLNRSVFNCILILVGLNYSFGKSYAQQAITTGILLNEMTDMDRLTFIPEQSYKTIQFSSYDRRSVFPGDSTWFENADGFGFDPIPCFQRVLKEPGKDGMGEYLICDVNGPGAIVRLWTAAIAGTIQMFLDGKLVYDGKADAFFWNFPAEMSEKLKTEDFKGSLRQYDALYFPIPFAKHCKIIWKGNLKEIHFYHVGIRLYDKSTNVKTFSSNDINFYLEQIKNTIQRLKNPESLSGSLHQVQDADFIIPEGERKNVALLKGEQAIGKLQLYIQTDNPNVICRQSILRIYFDGASVPQIESPVGDFFGAAPGINPYESLPLSVAFDGTMTSRFVMPFKESARIEIENMSDKAVNVHINVFVKPYLWDEDRSMYMYARWRVDHNLKASGQKPIDIPYILAMGKGRLVGAACYLMNPTNVPTVNGNWWGEGDEKIFVDNNSFPSFFGTGSEDYYNYSWGSEDIFFYPYCGQPRNDGPGSRGFVTNFRWHILDDIPFDSKLAFYMELLHHGEVPGFAYARMAYMYGKKGWIDDHCTVSADDVRPMIMPEWNPIAFRGSIDYRFLNAEDIFKGDVKTMLVNDPIWAGGKALQWNPQNPGEKIMFEIQTSAGDKEMQFTLGRMENGGKFKMYINDNPVKLKDKDIIDLNETGRVLNRAYGTRVVFRQGKNVITMESVSGRGSSIVIDQLWVKDNIVTVDTTMINLLFPSEKNILTGGDGAISIVIDKNKSLWLWGDSFMGEVKDNKRDSLTSPIILGNLLVVLDKTKARTICGGTPEKPQPVIQSNNVNGHHAVYWPHHGFVKDNILHVFMSNIVFTGRGTWDFYCNSISYFRLSYPDFKIIDQQELASFPVNKVSYGFGFHEYEGYYYSYGILPLDFNGSTLHVARARLINNKLQQWEYYDGAGWTKDPAKTQALKGIDVAVSSQFSVFKHADKYILLTQERGIGTNDIYTFISDNPVGPWSNKKKIYSTPEPIQDNTLFAYNAMAHPQYDENGMLLVGYCVNTHCPSNLWKDASIYKPRFFRVPYQLIIDY